MSSSSTASASYDFEYFVIGGGSGGLASSKRAADILGEGKVMCCDFVKPSPAGSTWGLGGTCVNVGCIPKKLMHQAALLGHAAEDARKFGWNVATTKANAPPVVDDESADESASGSKWLATQQLEHSWGKMVEGVQNHIGSLNWGYRTALRDHKVKYENSYVSFVDAHTVKTVNKRGKEKTYTARNFCIAVGGRPRVPSIPGAEYAITSDDIFNLSKAPGKTLFVGASYIALECAGFLTGLGFDTTVMVRSIFLRGFDQQVANSIADYMEKHGTKFIRGCVPKAITKLDDGRLSVTFESAKGGGEAEEIFDTVCFAIGRDATTAGLKLENAGVAVDPASGKLVTDDFERTNVPHIYAVGDVLAGKPELTPVAIQAGILLADRLFKGASAVCEYNKIATTVFTPLEYGTIGYSEEQAIEILGEARVEVYHQYFTPLEWTVAKREDNICYGKLIVDKEENEKVIGLHILGPNAGEITQGFAIGFKMGATKAHYDSVIGIHPTVAEVFTTMHITKSSGVCAESEGC